MSTSRTTAIAIAKRYASAMFALAIAEKQSAHLVGEIRALADAVAASPELMRALQNPLISRARQSAVLQAIMRQALPLTQQSLLVLAAQGRASLIPYVADALDTMLADYEGTVTAEVISAAPLSSEIERQLRHAIADATGRDVKLRCLQDTGVLGGVAVRVGSHLLDATLAGVLNTMKTKLLVQSST